MVELRHPTIEGLTVDKPSDQVNKWVRAGWVKPPKPPKQEANQTFGPSDEEVKQDERK